MSFKQPKKKLGNFLKDNKNIFSRKKLIKSSIAIGTAIIGINMLLERPVTAAHTNVTSVTFEDVAGCPTCKKLVPTHANAHSNHSSHSSHSSY